MSLKVLQALHTLLGAHVQQANRRKIQDAEVGPQTPQGNQPDNMRVQGPQVKALDNLPQGGQYNPGLTPLQGSRRVRPIQGGNPWYDR